MSTPLSPELLEAEVERLRAEKEQLESRIGSVINEAGNRVKQVESRLEQEIVALREEGRRKEEEQARIRERNYLSSLSPSERAERKAELLQERLDAMEAEKEAERQAANDLNLIRDIVRQAVADGMPQNLIDTRSPDTALISFSSWQRKRDQQRIEALEKQVSTGRQEVVEEVAEVVRNVSGARNIATGAPMGRTSVNKDVDPVIEQAERLARQAKNGNATAKLRAGGAFFQLKYNEAKNGRDVSYDPRDN